MTTTSEEATTPREALELAMDKYRLASERMESSKARGRLANAEFWRQFREEAVEEMWAALEALGR